LVMMSRTPRHPASAGFAPAEGLGDHGGCHGCRPY
jgi:hypothetical protein